MSGKSEYYSIPVLLWRFEFELTLTCWRGVVRLFHNKVQLSHKCSLVYDFGWAELGNKKEKKKDRKMCLWLQKTSGICVLKIPNVWVHITLIKKLAQKFG